MGLCYDLRFMPTDHIIALLIAERDKLNVAIEALQGTKRRGRPPKSSPNNVIPAPEKKHHMRTAAARKAQAAKMRAYWKKKKAAK